MATVFYEQYKTESYRIHCQRKLGVGATGSGGDPDDNPYYDSNDDDDGEWDDDFSAITYNEYKDMDGLSDLIDADKKNLPKAALGYAFAKEETDKIIAWMEKFAAFLKAEAFQSSTAVRNLFRDNGQLHEYYHFNRSKSKNKKVLLFESFVFHRPLI
jgi:hypothetical protein